ncbi:hypothetical protein Dimus_010215 [Dionaea muscipula]
MTVIHLKKKDVVKSSVKGISIEFDHERLAAILDVPGRTGICEYIKEVWEESRYTKPLDITRRIANDETITVARRVKSIEGESGSDDQFYDAQVGEEEPSDETQATPAIRSFISSSAAGTRHYGSRPLVPHWQTSGKLNLRNSKQSLKEKGQTDFMMIWRRPKLRMPDF